MTQQLAMYRGQVATVVNDIYEQVDVIDPVTKQKTGTTVQNTGKARLVFFDSDGQQQIVVADRSELTPYPVPTVTTAPAITTAPVTPSA